MYLISFSKAFVVSWLGCGSFSALWASLFAVNSAIAQPLPSYHQLPIDLAVEVGMEAIAACQQLGYRITVTVVDREGQRQFVAKGDGAAPHTLDNSFNKAYTAVSMGPIYKKYTTSELATLLVSQSPSGSYSPPPGISLSSGGIAIRMGDEIIAGIGVSGGPGGKFDEACARAGVEKISNRLLR